GTTTYEATGLATGTVYTYTITALGDGETSSDSAPLTGTVTLLGALPDPASVTATATGQTSIEATWPPVANATSYLVQVFQGANEVASVPNAVSPQPVGGLAAGTAYTVAVIAEGRVQSSDADAVLSLQSPGAVTGSVTTAPVQLAAPTGVTAGPGPTPTEEIEVNWNRVDFANDYRVEYSSDSGATWTDANLPPGTVPPVVIAGLSPGTPYQFRVVAIDTTGVSQESAPSATVSATTASA
ncbi:MAG TPA: fibronectin type III domain-containing protein, partial [Micromonosporaceae bacterium]|nr:fibronectin type III domain-containing protein [Micromonosporaceae bacterium]